MAVVRTRPETVIEDYGRVMDLAGYRDVALARSRHAAQAEPVVDEVLSGVLVAAVAGGRRRPQDARRRVRARAGSSRSRTRRSSPTRCEGCRNNRWEPVLTRAGLTFIAAARRRVAGLSVQEPAAEAERDLPGGHPDPVDLSGQADRAPADREDARPRGDDRLGQELVRRAAARSAALRAQVHARGAGRPPLHAARAAPRRLHGDGRHGGRRRRRTAHDDPARRRTCCSRRPTRWRSTRSPRG